MNRNMAIAIVLIVGLVGVAYGPAIYQFIDNNVVFPWETTGPVIPTGTQFSKFSVPIYRTDTSTATASLTTTVWYDENTDGQMQQTELRGMSDSSGTYTTLREYPIGDGFDIWIQAYGATYYGCSYTKVSMSGTRNSDGSAKLLDQDVYVTYLDDSLTFAGLIASTAWDDSSDYNYTLSGTTGLAEVDAVLSAADKGLTSDLWEGENYQTIYGISKPNEYWMKWDVIQSSGFDEDNLMAPNFFAIYMTVQDKIDSAIDLSDFDINYSDGTNWYCIQYVSSSWGDLIYNTADSSAPRPTIEFDMGTFTGAGTTVATYGVGIATAITYAQMLAGTWTKSATYYFGTCGNDWDWTA